MADQLFDPTSQSQNFGPLSKTSGHVIDLLREADSFRVRRHPGLGRFLIGYTKLDQLRARPF